MGGVARVGPSREVAPIMRSTVAHRRSGRRLTSADAAPVGSRTVHRGAPDKGLFIRSDLVLAGGAPAPVGIAAGAAGVRPAVGYRSTRH